MPEQERWEEPDAEYYVHSGAVSDKGASHASTSPSGEDLEIDAGSVSSTKVRSWPHWAGLTGVLQRFGMHAGACTLTINARMKVVRQVA